MTNKKRILSPHLSIYKLPINAIGSILHRITGMILFATFSLFIWIFIFLASKNFHPKYLWLVNNNVVHLVLIVSIYALYYHLFTGIRHFIWDVGYGFDKSTLSTYSFFIIICSLLCSTFSTIYIYFH